MGLMQKAIETFDNMEHLAGVEKEGQIETLAPVGHIIAKASVQITIDSDGNFVSAAAVDKKIPIPATEESSILSSSKIAPHALCNKIEYICPDEKKKRDKYVAQLKEWAESEYSHPKIKAVLNYVKSETIKNDLISCELLKLDDNKKIKNEDNIICWCVAGSGENESVWNDRELHKLYLKFYLSKIKDREKSMCMISGEETVCTQSYFRGVYSQRSLAKIISKNDDKNFTYRGRFINAREAFEIGYIQSQKAFNALRWIAENQGVIINKRAFVCWNPDGVRVPEINLPFLRSKKKPAEPSDYKKQLYDALYSYQNELKPGMNVTAAVFDTATDTITRLAIIYYNEFQSEDFLERLRYWDETCCWHSCSGISSPNLDSIAKYAFGVRRGEGENAKIEVDEKIKKQILQRLIFCRLEKQMFPRDIVLALFNKTKNLQIYSKSDRDDILFTVCAVIRKYHFDRYKEELKMSLEKDKKDRSYQFGRLLAVFEKIESEALSDKKDENKKIRETSAMRLQSAFVQRPADTSKIIMNNLKNAYYPKLDAGIRVYYEKIIGEIFEILSEFSADFNKPLTPEYMLGYYLQQNEFYKKRETTDTEVNDNE